MQMHMHMQVQTARVNGAQVPTRRLSRERIGAESNLPGNLLSKQVDDLMCMQ